MLETFNNYVGGAWIPSRSGATFHNENPAFRESNLGLFQASSSEDILQAIAAAEDAFRAWRCTSLADRQQYVAEFLRLLKESGEELVRMVTLENGKTSRESRAEVDFALIEGTYHEPVVGVLRPHRPLGHRPK